MAAIATAVSRLHLRHDRDRFRLLLRHRHAWTCECQCDHRAGCRCARRWIANQSEPAARTGSVCVEPADGYTRAVVSDPVDLAEPGSLATAELIKGGSRLAQRSHGCGRGKGGGLDLGRRSEETGLWDDLDSNERAAHGHHGATDWVHALGDRIRDISTDYRTSAHTQECRPGRRHHAERVRSLSQDGWSLERGQLLGGLLLSVHEISMPLLQRCELERARTKRSI